jgi:hypothetical protein
MKERKKQKSRKNSGWNVHACLARAALLLLVWPENARTLHQCPVGRNFGPITDKSINVAAFFALSEPTWICDLGSGKKNRIFYQMTPDFEGYWFFAAY